MQLNHLDSDTLAHMFGRLDPLVLVVDVHGLILDRHVCSNDRVPLDLLDARSLRSVLSTAVCNEWLRVIRGTVNDGRVFCTVAILDGRGHEAVCTPHAILLDGARSPVALLSLLPTALCNGAYGLPPEATRTLLRAHEWGPLEPLSRCQLDTLRNVTLGLGNEEIARKICRTKRAVEWHIRFLNQQLCVSGRERLAMIGRDAGLDCFTGCEWDALLKTRPARRSGAELVNDAPAQPAAAA